MFSRSRGVCLVAMSFSVIVTAACKKQRSPVAEGAQPATQPPAQHSLPPPNQVNMGDRPLPWLVDVDPDFVNASGNSVEIAGLHVHYKIIRPAGVTSAYLQLWNDAAGVIESREVPVSGEGEVDWTPKGPINIGPQVRFQAHCPSGDSNSFIWGQPKLETTALPAITNVIPNYAPEAIVDDPNPAHVGVPVRVWGNGLEGCTLAMSINGHDVPLPLPDRFNVFVKRDDLGAGPVFTRWFELKFIIRSPQGGAEYPTRVRIIDQ
jgi:hypothetical protein